MKTLGLMGGMSWASTIEYYRYINEGVNKRLGGNHAAKLAMFSVNFGEIADIVAKADWDRFLEMATQACRSLEAAGAEGIILCANTAHIVADRLQPRLKVPLIHIVDAVATEIKNKGLDRVSLLGTRFTMEAEFFRERLRLAGVAASTPEKADRDWIHATIFNELGKNIFLPATKQRYLDIIGALTKAGAQGTILGCTEIPLIIKADDVPVPSFDTTAIHAEAAVTFALS